MQVIFWKGAFHEKVQAEEAGVAMGMPHHDNQ